MNPTSPYAPANRPKKIPHPIKSRTTAVQQPTTSPPLSSSSLSSSPPPSAFSGQTGSAALAPTSAPTLASTSASASASEQASHLKQSSTPSSASSSGTDLPALLASRISQLESECTTRQQEEDDLQSEIRLVNTEIGKVQQVDVLQQRFMDLFKEHKSLERDLARHKRTAMPPPQSTKLQHQNTKLGSLARDLQKTNKDLTRDNDKHRATLDAERASREAMAAKFEDSVSEIRRQMELGKEESRRCSWESLVLKSSYRDLFAQYLLREKHFTSHLASKDLEIQLFDTKLRDRELYLAARSDELKVKDSMLAELENEMTSLRSNLVESQSKCSSLLKSSANTEEVNTMLKDKLWKFNQASDTTDASTTRNHTKEKGGEGIANTLEDLSKERLRRERIEGVCRSLQADRKRLFERLSAAGLLREGEGLGADVADADKIPTVAPAVAFTTGLNGDDAVSFASDQNGSGNGGRGSIGVGKNTGAGLKKKPKGAI